MRGFEKESPQAMLTKFIERIEEAKKPAAAATKISPKRKPNMFIGKRKALQWVEHKGVITAMPLDPTTEPPPKKRHNPGKSTNDGTDGGGSIP
jgi:hypothetical protein